MNKQFKIQGKLEIIIPEKCINDKVKAIIEGLLFHSVSVSFAPAESLYIGMGEYEPVELCDEGVISVTERGAYIAAKDERALINCLFLLLRDVVADELDFGNERVLLPVGCRHIAPPIKRRMVHFCIVPGVALSTYQKLIRLAAVLGYTHIVLEFWGTFRYDCLQELSWRDCSFTKDEVRLMLNEARALGVGVIPMVNHFGHASACRVGYGKHVVLDQNPHLSHLFSPDGWIWRFERPDVRELFRQMRRELCEVFGEGEYFHVGFDEGFSYKFDNDSVRALADYMGDVCREVIAAGRTPMLWGDQFLHEETLGIGQNNGYEGNAPDAETALTLLGAIPKESIICDWQYVVRKDVPWKSAQFFAENGMKTLICPWTDAAGFNTAMLTAQNLDCYGIMHTTWDRLFSEGNVNTLFYAHDSFFGREPRAQRVGNMIANAALLRRIWQSDGSYERSGWGLSDFKNNLSM
ncbi:MAG: hypothetical protein E7649_05815 [Ruminococcaceae bacterium]|nr:hypothetical protein [Oscillospiraceae bacterium]